MKKLTYIFALFITVVLVSCNKQEIKPVTDNTPVSPIWNFEKGTMGSDDSIIFEDGSNGESGDGDITDPNNDPDGKTKG